MVFMFFTVFRPEIESNFVSNFVAMLIKLSQADLEDYLL